MRLRIDLGEDGDLPDSESDRSGIDSSSGSSSLSPSFGEDVEGEAALKRDKSGVRTETEDMYTKQYSLSGTELVSSLEGGVQSEGEEES